MKTVKTALRLFIMMSLIIGMAYPFLITVTAKIFFPHQAGGSLVIRDGRTIGSKLIGQAFVSDRYFWPRPSSIGYNPLPSGGSNLGPTSASLKAAINKRRLQLQTAHGQNSEVPTDLLSASASGLDPQISPEAARYQVDRILKARDLDRSNKTLLNMLIDKYTEAPTWYFLGESRVNVLKLNLALDSLMRIQ